MANYKPTQTEKFKAKQFKAKGEIPGDQPLAKKPISIKLPVDVDAAIKALPDEERVTWLRKVICNGAYAELLHSDQGGKSRGAA